MMRSPILAFFSPPVSPTHTPVPVPRPAMPESESPESNIALFTHQDGKKFEVSIVRLDEVVDLGSDDLHSCREEDWDSDDWDEDAEDWEEPLPQQQQPRLHLAAIVDWTATTELTAPERRRPEERGADREGHQSANDWDGDAEDLEEPPVAKWSEGPERPDWVRRVRDADVWRTRLAED